MARNGNTNKRGSAKGLSNQIAAKSLVGSNRKKGGATGSKKATRGVSQA